MSTYSKTFNGIVDAVVSPCDIFLADSPKVFHTKNALWDTYLINLRLPSGDMITNFEVMASDYDDYDVIIGMDVIMHGDFHLDNSSGRSVFSFRL